MEKRSKPVKRPHAWLAVAVIILAMLVANSGLAGAQQTPSGTGQAFKPAGTTEAAPSQERTPQAVAAAAVPSPKPGDDLINLPTESLDAYNAKKATASQGKENAPAAKASERPTSGPQPLAEPVPGGPNFKGVDRQTAGCLPPDTHGAVGLTHYLEIVNCRVRVFDKSNNALVRDQNLSTFFGDTDFDFDPRALYDSTWNRFVVLATRKADSPTDAQRYYWLGVSTTSNPTGSFFIYRVNFGFNPGDWCDYPQLGMDQDAIIVTCNMFHVNNPNGTSNFVSTYVTSIAKARLYNGQGFSVPNFVPGFASIAPPLVAGLPMQQSNKSYLVAADSGADVIRLFRMENTARPSETTLVLQANVPVPAWDIPPSAFNGGGPLLDTLDGRFQNNSAQNGTSLWAVHSERIVRNGVPYSRPRFYEINTSTNALVRNGIFFLDFTSDDWNSSLAVNANQQVFFTFTSARANLFPQIRTEGCEVAVDNCNVFGGGDIGPGTLIQSSSAFSDDGGRRYGDYTSVSLDPTAVAGCAAHKRAWITNQYVDASDHFWDARIARIGFC